MRNHALPALMASLMLLGACATATPYAPLDGRFGYSDQQIEEDRFRVAFQGNNSTTRETVETFLLYRAAELTLAEGHDYFIVVEQDTETARTYQSTGFHDPYLYGFYPYGFGRFPYYAYGYPWAYEPTTIRERRRFEALAYIVVRSGEKPADDIRAYDARDVIANLGPRIVRPE